MKKIYIDACVIMSYLKRDTDRFPTIDAAFTASMSSNSKVRFFTSTITLLEVTRITDDGSKVTQSEFDELTKFWKTVPITQVDLNQICASNGQVVMQRRLLESKKNHIPLVKKRVRDLAHLGTAMFLKVDEYWSYDDDFGSYPASQMRITTPYIDQLVLPET